MDNLSWVKPVLVAIPVFLLACQNQSGGLGGAKMSQYATLKVSLIDAPKDELKEVHVNVRHFEVLLAGEGKQARVKFSEGLGDIDLLTLQNGVQLPLTQMQVPDGLQIQQIRMVLEDHGHYSVKADDTTCELRTPSAQKTGIKIILTNQWSFEKNHDYNLIVDFDAKKSVILLGNGECLLKPVLKLASALKKEIVDPGPLPTPDLSSEGGAENPLPSPDPEVEDLIGVVGDTNDVSGDGFDNTTDDDTLLIDPDDLDNFFGINF